MIAEHFNTVLHLHYLQLLSYYYVLVFTCKPLKSSNRLPTMYQTKEHSWPLVKLNDPCGQNVLALLAKVQRAELDGWSKQAECEQEPRLDPQTLGGSSLIYTNVLPFYINLKIF